MLHALFFRLKFALIIKSSEYSHLRSHTYCDNSFLSPVLLLYSSRKGREPSQNRQPKVECLKKVGPSQNGRPAQLLASLPMLNALPFAHLSLSQQQFFRDASLPACLWLPLPLSLPLASTTTTTATATTIIKTLNHLFLFIVLLS
jgi:hypothetical protein